MTGPQVWNYRQCAEVDGQFLYSGPAWDLTARTFAALTINSALNTSLRVEDVSEGKCVPECIGRANKFDVDHPS